MLRFYSVWRLGKAACQSGLCDREKGGRQSCLRCASVGAASWTCFQTNVFRAGFHARHSTYGHSLSPCASWNVALIWPCISTSATRLLESKLARKHMQSNKIPLRHAICLTRLGADTVYTKPGLLRNTASKRPAHSEDTRVNTSDT